MGIGALVQDLPLLAAMDHSILLPIRKGEFSPELTSRLPRAMAGEAAGPLGWNTALLRMLKNSDLERQ